MVDGDEEYEVETIMGHKFHGKGRKLHYLIKWVGYPTADNTWEPHDQVFAPEKIRQYHSRHPLNQPFPHKKGGKVALVRTIPLCQTLQSIPPSNPQLRRLPHSRFPRLQLRRLSSHSNSPILERLPSTSTKTYTTQSPLPPSP